MSYRQKLSEMVFTEEEKKELFKSRDEITKWCMENIVPRIPSGERIVVDFGDVERNMSGFGSTTSFHFCVWANPTKFYSYPTENAEGRIGVGEAFSGCSDAFHCYPFPRLIFAVVDNWHKIKLGYSLWPQRPRVDMRGSRHSNYRRKA